MVMASVQLQTEAQANFTPGTNMAGFELEKFYRSVLLQLEPGVGAQAVSNILWSSAKLGVNPDAFVPGMTDALAAKLLQLTKDQATCQPSAQTCANSLWALASLGHETADKGLIYIVCAHFAMLP